MHYLTYKHEYSCNGWNIVIKIHFLCCCCFLSDIKVTVCIIAMCYILVILQLVDSKFYILLCNTFIFILYENMKIHTIVKSRPIINGNIIWSTEYRKTNMIILSALKILMVLDVWRYLLIVHKMKWIIIKVQLVWFQCTLVAQATLNLVRKRWLRVLLLF